MDVSTKSTHEDRSTAGRAAFPIPRYPVRWIAAFVGLPLIAVIAVLASAPPATQNQAESPLVGHMAPAIKGETISGDRLELTSLREHFVVVDFFSSWCVPCRREQPELVKFAERAREGAMLVGVVFNDSASAIRALVGPWAGLYPVVADPGGRIALDYGVDNPPAKYIIDPGGIVVAKIIGPVTAAGLDAVIAHAEAQET